MTKTRWPVWLLAPIVTWMAAVYPAFLAGAAATVWGWPAHVELPWSDLQDFVQANNGDTYSTPQRRTAHRYCPRR